MKFEALVKEFADCVVAQDEAIARGDPATGNKYAKRGVAAFNKLRKQGDEGRDALSVLLEDSRANVRTMAAAFLLRHCGERARAVLEAEAKGKGLLAFESAQALQRWDEGTWALDPA